MLADLVLYLNAFPVAAYSVAAVFGLIAGSFLTFLFYRLKAGEKWLWGKEAARSRCPSCRTNLAVRDLIPVLSWVLSKGRCRYCRGAISIRYPLIEVAAACVFMAALYLFRNQL